MNSVSFHILRDCHNVTSITQSVSARPAVANGWESSPRAACEQRSDNDDLVRKRCPVLLGSRRVIISDFKVHRAACREQFINVRLQVLDIKTCNHASQIWGQRSL